MTLLARYEERSSPILVGLILAAPASTSARTISARATSRASRWASDSTFHVFLCSFHMSFMHFASQTSACLHFEHLVLAAFPHHSHIPYLGIRVLAAELTPTWASDTLLGLLMTRQGGTRLGLAERPSPDSYRGFQREGCTEIRAVRILKVCG